MRSRLLFQKPKPDQQSLSLSLSLSRSALFKKRFFVNRCCIHPTNMSCLFDLPTIVRAFFVYEKPNLLSIFIHYICNLTKLYILMCSLLFCYILILKCHILIIIRLWLCIGVLRNSLYNLHSYLIYHLANYIFFPFWISESDYVNMTTNDKFSNFFWFVHYCFSAYITV